MLNILVIHGYVQSAATVAANTLPLKEALSDIANLHYVDGPPMNGRSSRPWWILDSSLEHDMRATDRWNDVVRWWSEELSKNQYDGIIGLSQGAAMAALLLSMLNHPNVPNFIAKKSQPIKFAILCSGFISKYEPHGDLYRKVPDNVPTFHTLDTHDMVVPAQKTVELQKLFKISKLLSHNEGHSIPVHGAWPRTIKEFIVQNSSPSSA